MNDQDKPQGPDAGGPNPWMKHLLIWVGILVAGALFVTMLDGRAQTAGVNTIPYSAFLDKVEAGLLCHFQSISVGDDPAIGAGVVNQLDVAHAPNITVGAGPVLGRHGRGSHWSANGS